MCIRDRYWHRRSLLSVTGCTGRHSAYNEDIRKNFNIFVIQDRIADKIARQNRMQGNVFGMAGCLRTFGNASLLDGKVGKALVKCIYFFRTGIDDMPNS